MRFMDVTLSTLATAAEALVAQLPHARGARACVVGLSGELGAGKTAFTQLFARVLGITNVLPSPTYVFMSRYPLVHPVFTHLVHIDAYRLEKPEDAHTIGWQEIMSEPQNLVIVEWPEKLGDLFPKDARKIFFTVTGPDTRDLRYA